jgi:hypothetical protein
MRPASAADAALATINRSRLASGGGRILGEGEIGLYDKIVPAIRRLEGRVKPPIGQSLVALLRTSQ